MGSKIRLLLVDDHAILREGMCAFLATRPDVEVVGEAEDGNQAVEQARLLQPDVILMDLSMPGKNGMEAILEIMAENPQARILVLTSFSEDENVSRAIQAGALGYLMKDSTSGELIQAIHSVYQGEISMKPDVVNKMVRGFRHKQKTTLTPEPLTEREKTVLALIGDGKSNLEISRELCLSEYTVRTHVRNLLGKLHMQNRTQAALYAVKEGLVKPAEGEMY